MGDFRITSQEATNLGDYLTSGGFVFAEPVSRGAEGSMLGTPWEIALRQMLEDALSGEGFVRDRDWAFEPLPGSHPIYHCYFDFSAPPPATDAFAVARGYDGEISNFLEGLEVHGRLVAILSKKGYLHPWFYWGPGKWYEHLDPTRQFQFGVNLIVFALTQEGSITHRLMDTVR